MSFNRAAEELGYTPSAISQQIVSLERVVGERVIERSSGPRPIRITEAGRVLLAHARAVLARMDAAAADIDALSGGAAGEFRVGVYQSIATRLLPELLAEFRRDWPRIDVQLFEAGSHDEIDAMVERGALDLAFTIAPAARDEVLACTELLTDPYVLVLPRGHELASMSAPLTLGRLGEIDMVAYRACRAHAQVRRFLRSHGVELRVVFHAEDNALIQRCVAAGIGAAIMPLLAVDTDQEDIALRDLDDLVPRRRMGLVFHRDRYRPPAHLAFTELAQHHAARLSEHLTNGNGAVGPDLHLAADPRDGAPSL
jgi:DNA-binding transcriptional LysR family regulator